MALFYAMSRDGKSFTARVGLPTHGVAHHQQIRVARDGSLLAAWDELKDGTRHVGLARGAVAADGRVQFNREPRRSKLARRRPLEAGDQAQKANIFRQIGLARRFRQEAETTIKLDPKHIEARRGMITFLLKTPIIVGGDGKKAAWVAVEYGRNKAVAGYLSRPRVASNAMSTG